MSAPQPTALPSGPRRRGDGATSGSRRSGRSSLRRWLRVLAVLLAVGAAVALVSGGVAAQETISGCQDIGSSGEYVLEGDVASSTDRCLYVGASDVTIDGNGHEIRFDGSDASQTTGIEIQGTNVTVHDVTVTGWGRGVYVYDGDGVTIRDSTATDVGTGVSSDDGHNAGFSVADSNDVSITSSTARNVAGDGVWVRGTTGATLSALTLDSNTNGIFHRSQNTDATLTVRDTRITSSGTYGVSGYAGDYDLGNVTVAGSGTHEISLNETGATGSAVSVGGSGTTGTTLDFTATSVTIDGLENPPDSVDGNASIGHFVRTADASDSGSGGTIDATVTYEDEDVLGVDESTLGLWERFGGSWRYATDADETSNQITYPAGELGTYGAFAEPVPYFDVTVDGTPTAVEGDDLTVVANVTNRGKTSGTQTVTISGDEGLSWSDDRSVGLDPGASTDVEFVRSTARGDNGTYAVTVTTENESTTTDVRIRRLPYLNVTIDVDATVPGGDDLTVAANLTNRGDLAAEQTVELRSRPENGSEWTERDRANVSVPGRSSQLHDLVWNTSVEDVGNYTLQVETANDTATSDVVRVQEPANYTIQGTDANTPVTEGDTFELDVTVLNRGEAPESLPVTLSVDGERVDSASVSAPRNETDHVVLTWDTTGEAGEHDVRVATPHDAREHGLTVGSSGGGIGPPPSSSSLGLGITGTNSPVDAGETVTVTARVSNAGFSSVTETVELRSEDDVVLDAAEVTIAGGSAETVTLSWATSGADAGTHRLGVHAGAVADWTTVAVRDGSVATGASVRIDRVTSPVVEGQPVDVRATVDADAATSGEVVLRAPDGRRVDAATVSLSGGSRETVDLTWETEPGDVGTGEVTVAVAGARDSARVEVREHPPFEVAVEDTNAPVDAGERLRVDVAVESRADERRTGYVSLTVDGERRDGQTVALDAGERRTVTLAWQTGDADVGEHEVLVRSGASSTTSSVAVRQSGEPGFEFPEVGGWAVDYEPSPQTRHVGGFLWLTVVVGGLGAYVLVTRETQDARLLGVTLLTAAARTGTDVLHATVGGITREPLLALNTVLELYVGLLFLAFAATYVGTDWLVRGRGAAGLAGVALLGTAVVATNPLHGLVFSDVALAEGAFTYVTADTGPLGYVLLAVTFGSLVVSAGLLLRSFLAGTDPAWRPMGVLASGLFLAALVVGLSAVDRGPLGGYDYTGAGVAGFLALAATTLFTQGLQRVRTHAQRSLIQDLDDPIVICNDAHVVVEFNAAAAALFDDLEAGTRLEAVVGIAPEWPEPGESTRVERRRDELLGTVVDEDGDATDLPSVGGAEAGDEPYYQVTVSSVTAETAGTVAYTVRLTDVTELRRRTEELQRRNAQLEQVASTISHDLRNPLGVAEGYVDLLRDDVPGSGRVEPDAVDQHLGPIRRAVGRMDDIIEDVVALARSSTAVTTPEQLDFRDVVEEAWRTVDTAEATLFVESSGTIFADRKRMRRILENLFRNAVEHAGEDVSVVAGLSADGFYVADDGPGIPSEHRESIFEEGYTSSSDGTGLGLAIVTQLARAHGWRIHLDPDYGGARFVFTGCDVEREDAEQPPASAVRQD